MNWEAIGAIGEILGATAVCISLVYLAIQIRRSDRVTRSSNVMSVNEGYSARSNIFYAEHPELAALFVKGCESIELLTDDERATFHFLLHDQVAHVQNVVQLFRDGLVPHDFYENWIRLLARMLKTPGGAEYWKNVAPFTTESFRRQVEDYLSANPGLPPFEHPFYLHLSKS